MNRNLITLFFFICTAVNLLAQRDRQMPTPDFGPSTQVDTTVFEDIQDTVILTALDTILLKDEVLFLSDHVYVIRRPDSTLEFFHWYNPAEKYGTMEYVGLGNLGDPKYKLSPHLPEHPGFRLGVHAYDYLLFTRENRYINNTRTPETDVRFVHAGSNRDIMLEANYAYTFNSRLNATINYRRINHDGMYSFQKNRHTQLSIAGYYRFNTEYHIESYAIINDIKTQNNGGILNDSLLYLPGAERRKTIPVQIQEGRTLMGFHQYGLRHVYRPEQLTNISWVFEHAYLRHRFFYYDNAPPVDFSIYRGLLSNPIGARHLILHQAIEHTATHRQKFGPTLNGALSLRHAVHFIQQALQRNTQQSIEAIGSAQWQPDSAFQIGAKARIGLYGNRFAWSLDGSATYTPGNIFQLDARVRLMEYLPSIIQQGIQVSFEEIYRENFSNTRGLHFQTGAMWKPVGLSAGFGITQYQRFIFYNDQALPETIPFITIPQFKAGFKQRLGPLVTNHVFTYYPIQHLAVPMPEWYSTHSLSLEGKIFREAMLASAGFDLRLNAIWETPDYMPITGNYITSGGMVETYPWLDFHFSFKVSRFRAFLILENILDFVIEPVHYQIAGYPMRDFTFRLGIDWRFVD